jgi:hypothetical protein
MVSVPVRVPVAVGVNSTVTTHVDAPARTLVQPELVWEKSPPIETPVMLRVAVPLSETITNWPKLVVPTACLVNVSVEAESVTVGLVGVVVVEPLEPPPQPAKTINPMTTARTRLRAPTSA